MDAEAQLLKELNEVTDPAVLKEFLAHLLKENFVLSNENKLLKKIEEEKSKARQLVMEDGLLVLRKILFGKSSEKREKPEGRPRDLSEQEVLLHSQCLVPPPKDKETRKLPEEIKTHEMSEIELKEESEVRGISNDWEKVDNFYDESKEVTVIERQYKTLIHRRQKYRHKGSTKDNQIIISASGADKLLPGCGYSVDFAVEVVSDKYENHLPLERQRRMMERNHLSVPVKTLYNLSLAVGVHMESAVTEIKKEILASKLTTHADESPWPIQDKKDSDGYMWVISNQVGAIYNFEPTRSGKVIEELFKGYSGNVLTDGFSGYNILKKLQNITLSNCWAHARRKFIEIEPNYPDHCKEVLDLIDKLFANERGPKTIEELQRVRAEKSKPLIDEIYTWLIDKKMKARAESHLMKAIGYCLKFWEGLTVFLKDSSIPLSNNDAERAIRHAVMGRKNFYGSKTINGADTTATLYSVIESCKRVQVDPKFYIKMAVLRSIRKETIITPLQFAKERAA
jgi:transposase